MPRAFTERERGLIGKQLLEQGYRFFSAYGLRKANVEEIAKAAGISKGAFYNFYDSKESLFMDVVEQVEARIRQKVLVIIDLPGPSPRARLFAVLKKTLALFRTMPILQVFTGSDFDLLFRRLPAEKLQEHLARDRAFFEELIARCQSAGIPIRAQPERIMGLLYLVVLAVLHEDDLGRNEFVDSTDLLLDLVAAFCLGEVEIPSQEPVSPVPDPERANPI